MSSIISVSNLVKKYKNVIAVDDITFTVERGEVFAFLGPNGAGKTTTIKVLTTLLFPTSGQVAINGYNPTTQQDLVRKSFGIVFQDPSLDDELTAWENLDFHGVLYGMDKATRHKRMNDLLEIVQLSDKKKLLVKTFSGGMKRRLEIARGLIHHPLIYFLDEPTIGLDPQTRNQIWNYIIALNKMEGTTVFFTTHYLEEAERYSHRLAIIDHGKIVACGDLAYLKDLTQSEHLEEAFLKLTGHEIREESAGTGDNIRMRLRARR
ncbi:multidrug ABC transporter ATP-binding protein [candidate division WWE3 bacterium CG08_land_8_20_14_0_20_43_13]|uniref:Multidrug ABC transporter ATP-binding protein n=2 Tax=Bacteria candidate phyla TaxID=1783234 RepID=A0A2H0X7S7_UNCKA|nr:MAG: multidrug ABC transporter ATP-binding protein [candidate division WWE3 bacterium CG08_land_8_20_14_0_20_43_13]PJE73248.1 MAG: multidrug ABC transporter ATP-binding protein [Candidatus Tagabacteria bacterium CG10_big_fil_rev_8_21_14_0_10_40_13]